ncbi:molybdenum cofactor biosynthesis protein B [Hyphococcus sp.]|uniref:molybdenum cofactor biosynthesis protein B n=1 Tax=Hyphococcus sp. TaxID=2038636 RepID=UPI00375282FC
MTRRDGQMTGEKLARGRLVHGINEALEFKPVRIAVLTVTDSRTRATDTSGDLLAQRIETAGHILAARELVRDDTTAIQETVTGWIDDPQIDAVISTGGTGLTGRDVTPEALSPLFEKEIEGFSVIFHQVSFQSVGLSTLQSRACAGVTRGTFIFALPGSNGAVKDGWDKVISLQLDSRHRPCNLVELMPRLMEK